MKTIRWLIAVSLLAVASTCFAFSSGNVVQVVDRNSPYFYRLGVVLFVVDAGTDFEQDVVSLSGNLQIFSASQLIPRLNLRR